MIGRCSTPRRARRPAARFGVAFVFAALTALALGCGGPRVAVERTSTLMPDHVDPHAYAAFLRAELHRSSGELEAAAEALREVVRNDPTAGAAHLQLARVLAEIGAGADEGLRACRLAEGLDVPIAEVAQVRARLHLSVGDQSAAMAAYSAVPIEEASEELFAAWVRDALLEDQREEATARYIEAWPESAPAWRARATALRDAGDLVGSAEAFGRAMTLPDGWPDDAYRRILGLVEIEEFDEATATAADCRDRFWEYWPCISWQAVLRHRMRDPGEPPDEATQAALQQLAYMVVSSARQLASSGHEVRMRGGDTLATEYAKIVADTRPNDVAVVTSSAWMAYNLGDLDLAVELMQRVLEIDDANFDALNFIGYTWADQGTNLEQAKTYIEEALFLRGDDGNILDSLAWVLYRLERYDEALEVQLRAVALVPDNAVIWDHLGDIYSALGRLEEAIDAWEHALEFLDGQSEDVAERTPPKIERAREQAQP